MSTNELEKALAEYKGLQRMREDLAAELDAIKASIRAAMDEQGVDTLTVGLFKVSDKLVTSARIDTTALKAELPDIASRYTKSTQARRFVVA